MRALTAVELDELIQALDGDGSGARASLPVPAPARRSYLANKLSDATGADLAELRNTISRLSSDVPRGTGKVIGCDGKPVDDYWFGVILAVRRDFGESAEGIAREWSRQSARYTEEGFAQAWDAYDPAHPNPVTMASVYQLAAGTNWSPDSGALFAAPLAHRFLLLDRSAILALPALSWRAKGLFPTTGIGVIFGPSSAGKSFLALDVAFHIAAGDSWFGHRTVAAPVTYVMLEGEAALRNRVKAWEKHHGRGVPSNFTAITQPVIITISRDVEDLGAILPKGGVVIIDTLNRAAPGVDENSSEGMGSIVSGLSQLQHITGGLVVAVHHTGKDASKGIRGHSSLHAALDAAVSVERMENSRCWSVAKAKDGEDGRAVPFTLHVVGLGQDADGDEITSCAVGPDSTAVFKRKEPSGKMQKLALAEIRRGLNTSTATGMAGSGPQTKCVKAEDAIEAVADTLAAVPRHKRRNRAGSIVESLIGGAYLRSGIDAQEEGWVWID